MHVTNTVNFHIYLHSGYNISFRVQNSHTKAKRKERLHRLSRTRTNQKSLQLVCAYMEIIHPAKKPIGASVVKSSALQPLNYIKTIYLCQTLVIYSKMQKCTPQSKCFLNVNLVEFARNKQLKVPEKNFDLLIEKSARNKF